MRKKICLLLLIALLFLPHMTSANAPVPDPWELTVYLPDIPEGTTVTAFYTSENGSVRQGETYTSNGAKNMKIGLWYTEDETRFCLALVSADGVETRTPETAIEPRGIYTYDSATHTLTVGKPKGTDTDLGGLAGVCLDCGAMILLYVLAGLLAPIAVTLLVEWLVALCFGIRPVRYVFAINAITNPVMNILLLIVSSLLSFSRAAYWIVLAVLEIAVVFIEFAFYRKKYPDRRPARLLLFSVTANVLSLAVGGLIPYFLL